MIKPPLPSNEKERLRALRNYEILDSAPEEKFDRITELASLICDVPISQVSLIDETRQWFKSSFGLDATQTHRDRAFCNYTILDEEVFEVEDATKDGRFKHNALVTDTPNIRYYAGYPLIDPDGYALGSLCVIDREPKVLDDKQKRMLKLLAGEVSTLIVERRLSEELRNFEKLFKFSDDLLFIGGIDGYFKKVNPAFTRVLGWTQEQLLNTSSFEFYHPDDVAGTKKELQKLSKGRGTVNFLQRFKTSRGNYKTIQWTSTPETNTGNIFGIGRDVSELKLKERQLAESEEKLRVFFENSLGVMCTHDLKGKFLSINNTGADVFGYAKKELLKMNLLDIKPLQGHPLLKDYLVDIKKNGHAKGQMTTRHKDGAIRTWLFNSTLEPNSGKPYVIVNGLDITDRHQLEKELRRTTQMLEQTNQVARVGGWEFDIATKKILWTSVTKELHGVAPGYEPDLTTCFAFYKEGPDRERILEVVNLAITQGKPYDEELRIITAKGEEIWVRELANAEVENGVCKRLYGTFQDIDDFKHVELALSRSLETQEKLNEVLFDHIELIEKQDRTIEKIQEFQFLADSIPQIVWTSNPDGSAAYYNKYWFDYTGLTLEESMTNGWQAIVHPEDMAEVAEISAHSFRTGKPYEAEVRFKRAEDGVYRWHIARARPMRDERGKITKWFGSCTDIDEYKRALDLENKISQFEDFNRIVAHNLRGPAGSIGAMLAMMAEAEDDDERAHLIEMLQQSSDTLTANLNELMKVLEVRNNRDMPYDDCNLVDMVEGVERMLRGQIIASKAVISTDFAVPSMLFPRIYLESIFFNMMSNALKYSKRDVPPQITIASMNVTGKTLLTFKDNGLGIDLEKYGNAIFKLNKTFHEGFDSKGVGLFMTKTQIETFGGHISVESEPGVGATFTITF